MHPYTKGLIGSIPILGQLSDVLDVIPGIVPSLIDLPDGCRFASRCVARIQNELDICTEQTPQLIEITDGHAVRCWLYSEGEQP
jgi:oligopeptide/dipeptide ABC transporter ATP-binding protein